MSHFQVFQIISDEGLKNLNFYPHVAVKIMIPLALTSFFLHVGTTSSLIVLYQIEILGFFTIILNSR